jgi:hypothetical protein
VIPLIFGGHLISPAILHSRGFLVLLTFVALNTLAYATLSMLKILPVVRWRRGLLTRTDPRNRRTESRSIYPTDKL